MSSGANSQENNRNQYLAREEALRQLLEKLAREGIHDPAVLRAIALVPRERFVAPGNRPQAFEDIALPTALNQTISQPLIVALMTQLLQVRPSDTVLEVGTGSGYQTAILSILAAQIVSIERYRLLAESSRNLLSELGYHSIEIHVGDGTLGWPAKAPYSRILVTAGAPDVPLPLLEQLAVGGRLVIPVGPRARQELVLVTRDEQTIHRVSYGACSFVPLVGDQAWQSD